MPLLNDLFHALPRLLHIVRTHLLIDLVLPDKLIVVLSRALEVRVGLLGQPLCSVDGISSRVAGRWGEGDLDGEWVVLLGREGGEGVR